MEIKKNDEIIMVSDLRIKRHIREKIVKLTKNHNNTLVIK